MVQFRHKFNTAFGARFDEDGETAAGEPSSDSFFAGVLGLNGDSKPSEEGKSDDKSGADGGTKTPEDNTYGPDQHAEDVGLKTPGGGDDGDDKPSDSFLKAISEAAKQGTTSDNVDLDPKVFEDAAKQIDYTKDAMPKFNEIFGEQNGEAVAGLINELIVAALADSMKFTVETTKFHGDHIIEQQKAQQGRVTLEGQIKDALGDSASSARVDSALILAKTIQQTNPKLDMKDVAAGAVRMLGGLKSGEKPDATSERDGEGEFSMSDIIGSFRHGG